MFSPIGYEQIFKLVHTNYIYMLWVVEILMQLFHALYFNLASISVI